MILYPGMHRLIYIFRSYFIFLFLVIILIRSGPVRAEDSPDEEKIRQATIVLTYPRYEWWLLKWLDNQILCQVYIDHEGLPTANEILTDCGGTVYNQWLAPPTCLGAGEGRPLRT